MSSVRLICPNLKCRTVLSVSAEARGKIVRCSKCGNRVQVPEGRSNARSAEPAADTTTS